MKMYFILIHTFLFNLYILAQSGQCVIVPGKGINNIVVGKSKLKDVITSLGHSKVEKKWHKAVEVEIIGRYEFYLQYSGIGVFSTYAKTRNKNTIKKITLTSNCKCRTKNGVGIGSTYDETIQKLGRPNQWFYKYENNTYFMKLFYNNMRIILDGRDTTKNKICKIEIYDEN